MDKTDDASDGPINLAVLPDFMGLCAHDCCGCSLVGSHKAPRLHGKSSIPLHLCTL